MVRDRVPVESVQDIMQEEYRPGSCTHLYDAMGWRLTISIMLQKGRPGVSDTITDGMENSSEEFSGKAIKELVSKKRERMDFCLHRSESGCRRSGKRDEYL